MPEHRGEPHSPPASFPSREQAEVRRDFWTQPLDRLTTAEWELLCDGCGRCCLHKLEFEDTGELAFTRVACRMLDIATCRCRDYQNRRRLVPDCLDLRDPAFTQFHWLPETCAYRRRTEGRELPLWHPLRSGRAASVHEAGVSVRHFALAEQEVDDLEDHVIESWDDGL